MAHAPPPSSRAARSTASSRSACSKSPELSRGSASPATSFAGSSRAQDGEEQRPPKRQRARSTSTTKSKASTNSSNATSASASSRKPRKKKPTKPSKPLWGHLERIPELKDHGNRLYEEKSIKTAYQVYTLCVRAQPSEPKFWLNRSLAALDLRCFKDAREDAKVALELVESRAAAFRSLSENYPGPTPLSTASGQFSRGMQPACTGRSSSPASSLSAGSNARCSPEVEASLGRLNGPYMGDLCRLKAQAYLRIGEAALGMGSLLDAKEALELADTLVPKDPVILHSLRRAQDAIVTEMPSPLDANRRITSESETADAVWEPMELWQELVLLAKYWKQHCAAQDRANEKASAAGPGPRQGP